MSADTANLITAEGLEQLKAELATLEGEGRREIAERIKTAREWGDLKENSEYHDAKNDQAHLETKIAKLRERISTAEVVEATEAPDGAVGFGSTVVVRDEAGKERKAGISSARTTLPPQKGGCRRTRRSPGLCSGVVPASELPLCSPRARASSSS